MLDRSALKIHTVMDEEQQSGCLLFGNLGGPKVSVKPSLKMPSDIQSEIARGFGSKRFSSSRKFNSIFRISC